MKKSWRHPQVSTKLCWHNIANNKIRSRNKFTTEKWCHDSVISWLGSQRNFVDTCRCCHDIFKKNIVWLCRFMMSHWHCINVFHNVFYQLLGNVIGKPIYNIKLTLWNFIIKRCFLKTSWRHPQVSAKLHWDDVKSRLKHDVVTAWFIG